MKTTLNIKDLQELTKIGKSCNVAGKNGLDRVILETDYDYTVVKMFHGYNLKVESKLQNIKLDVIPGKIFLTVSDFESLTKLAKNGDIELEYADNMLNVNINGISKSVSLEFNNAVFTEYTAKETERKKDLKEFAYFETDFFVKKFSSVIPFVSDDESKFCMCGVAIQSMKDNTVKIIGTDGRRLAYNTIVKMDYNGINTTIHRADIIAAVKHFKKDCSISMSIGANCIMLQGDRFTIYADIIKNEFPAWQRVVPEKQTNYFYTSLSSDQLDIFNSVVDKYKKTVLTVNCDNLHIENTDCSKGIIKQDYEIFGSNIAGNEVYQIALNYTYIKCILDTVSSNIKVEFTDCNRPLVITSNADNEYKAVVMPMNMI